MISVREATPSDMPGLLALARAFIAETAYEVEYDEAASRETFWLYISHPDGAVYVAEREGVIVGAIMLFAGREFQVRPFGYVSKMFVAPAGRGTTAARQLVAEGLAWFRRKGCSHAFATSTAGLGPAATRMFANLFGKFGFAPCGPCLERVL